MTTPRAYPLDLEPPAQVVPQSLNDDYLEVRQQSGHQDILDVLEQEPPNTVSKLAASVDRLATDQAELKAAVAPAG